MTAAHAALDAVLPDLRCPVCGGDLGRTQRRVACGRGHGFDLARQGYVNLLTGGGGARTGDSTAMVSARETVHRSGLLDGVVRAVAAATPPSGGLVVDLAGGTGHYLAAVLDQERNARGLVLDNSAAALRRAARAHPRAAAAGADAWQPLPLRSGSVATALSVFGPRDPAELHRVLAAGGHVVVGTPQPGHLSELVEPLGLVRVDPDKDERRRAAFAPFNVVQEIEVSQRHEISRDLAAAVIGMGPSARHVDPHQVVGTLPDELSVTVAVRVTRYRR